MRQNRMKFPGLLLLLLLSGCYTRDTVLFLRWDGSGMLEITTTATKGLLDYAQRQAGMPPEEFWFNERVLEQAAAGFGEGVHYLNHRIEDVADGKRFVVSYRVADIRTLILPVDTDPPFFLDARAANERGQRPVYRLSQTENTLQITPPPERARRPSSPHVQVESARVRQQREERLRQDRQRLMRDGNPFRLTGRESAEDLARILSGEMRFSVRVQLPAPPKVHTAKHLEGQTLTLFALEAREVLSDNETMRRAVIGEAHRLRWEDLISAPGVKAEIGETVVLQF